MTQGYARNSLPPTPAIALLPEEVVLPEAEAAPAAPPDLRRGICETAPRERGGGSRASNRFGYQLDWAFGHLLDLHASGCNYALTLDYHEDVVVFDSDIAPKVVRFYQVKTRRGMPWRLSNLISSPKGQLSILGKLIDNRLKFGAAAESLTLISNNCYALHLADGRKGESLNVICCMQLRAVDRAKVTKKLLEEHALAKDPLVDGITFFRVSDLSLDSHASDLRGRLVDFLDKQCPGASMAVVPFYQSVHTELKRRNDYEREISDFDELMKKKSVTRAEFSAMLDSVTRFRNPDELRREIDAALTAEGVPLNVRASLRRGCQRLEVKLSNPTDRLTRRLFRSVSDAVERVVESADVETHMDLLAAVRAELAAAGAVSGQVGDDLIDAMTLTAFHGR